MTKKVPANILLIEGWLPRSCIEMAYKEFQKGNYNLIVTTGLDAPEYFPVNMNGFLIFYLPEYSGIIENGESHTILVRLYSQLGGKHRAHFNLYINDSLVTDSYAKKHKKEYKIKWAGPISEIDSIMIQFDNDSLGNFGDRNLFVKEVLIDNEIIINYKGKSVYSYTADHVRKLKINNYYTHADLARNILYELNLDPKYVRSIPCKRVVKNRTLSSVLEFRNWTDTTDYKINGINIVSYGPHARRSWITYSKILKDSYPIGIISMEASEEYFISRRWIMVIKELIGNIYYRILLLTY
jgi:hypothetical protein